MEFIDFFHGLVDDEMDKKILKLVLEKVSYEQILDELLKANKEKEDARV